ncbi:MAG: hypothetical protein A3F67_10100 [Verrucomicrobia bacterium RIFCSPHIGHO2_12_FULL_41_10]|nr:MAG: hypothetical protein A3F67_10100 [Verrucomicrobia bacterium RIFCSPHIGHO2_12_FULL_41_10]
MTYNLFFSDEAKEQLLFLENNSKTALLKQVRKALGYLETNPRHPSLHTHEFTSLIGFHGEKIFEAYVQNNTPGAYRIFWHYGPDVVRQKKRIAVITIIAITPHP